MAEIKKNLFLQGASGMLGKQLVYRTDNGKTIVSTRPIRTTEPSESQQKQMKRFKYASIFAKAAIADEVLGPIYSEAAQRLEKFRSSYQLAVTDYLKAPEIGEISFDTTTSGAPVLIEAFEDPQVSKVQVSILADDDSIIESGEALLTSNGIQWEYVLPVDIPEGGKLEIKAYDIPGNESSTIVEF